MHNYNYTGCFYYTIGNIHPIFRSNLRAIQLLAVAKTCDIREYGCLSLLHQFVMEMNLIADVRKHYIYMLFSMIKSTFSIMYSCYDIRCNFVVCMYVKI